MPTIVKNLPTLSGIIDQMVIADDQKKTLKERVAAWGLMNWEETMVYQLVAFATPVEAAAVDEWEQWLKVMRGQDNTVTKIGYAELDSSPIDDAILIQEEFQQRLTAAAFWALDNHDIRYAMLIRQKLEAATNGELEFANLPFDLGHWYQRLYIVLCLNNFNALPDSVRVFFLASPLLVLSIQLGFDWDALLRGYFDTIMTFAIRKESIRQFSAFLLDNRAPIGWRNEKEMGTINFWIEKFRQYSRENFGAMELLEFLNSKPDTGFCTVEQKNIIRAVIELYTHLVNGFLIIPEGDVEAVYKIADQLEREEAKEKNFAMPESINWTELIKKPSLSDWDKQIIAIWFKHHADVSDIKKTIQTTAQNFDWSSDPYLANLLEINDILSTQFGPAGILIFFDEMQGKFVFNN